MNLKNSPIIKKAVRKIQITGFLLLLVEILCWFGISHLISGYYAFWLMAGLMFLGYLVGHVFVSETEKKLTLMDSARKLISFLLIVPSWIAKVVALVVVVPPLRRGVLHFVTRKFLPKELTSVLDGNENPLGGALGSMFSRDPSFYEQFVRNPQQSSSGQSQTSKYSGEDGDVIDVDYEVRHSHPNATTVEVDHASDYRYGQQKSLPEAEVIDVPYEWEK